MNVSTEMKNSDEELLAGLNKEMYQLIVTHSPPDIDLYGQPFRTERLFLSVPLEHPLANRKTLTPADLDGQNLLLYTDIGFWHSFCREKLPNAHFLMMNEWDAFGEVAGTGAFPSFITDAHMERDGVPQNRVVIPIIDEQAEATYYCVCRAESRDRYRQVFRALEKNEMKSAVPCTGQAYLNAGGPFRPNCGIIYPVSACEPQAKHEFSGIDTMFLSEHERYAKCELRNMV